MLRVPSEWVMFCVSTPYLFFIVHFDNAEHPLVVIVVVFDVGVTLRFASWYFTLSLHCVTARSVVEFVTFCLVSYTLRNRAHVVRIKARWLFLGRLSRPLGFVVCTSGCAHVWSLNVSISYAN